MCCRWDPVSVFTLFYLLFYLLLLATLCDYGNVHSRPSVCAKMNCYDAGPFCDWTRARCVTFFTGFAKMCTVTNAAVVQSGISDVMCSAMLQRM